MTYAQEIAASALRRAQERQHAVHVLTKADLAGCVAACSITPLVCDPQAVPKRRAYRPRENLRTVEFAQVLADGAALLEAKGRGVQ